MSVKITVSGEDEERAAVVEVLRGALAVESETRPYPNQDDPGSRVYLRAAPKAGQADAEAPERSQAQDAQAVRDLESQPWYPLQSGDVLLLWSPIQGETYLAADDHGEALLTLVSANHIAAEQLVGGGGISVQELWVETKPTHLSVVRAGQVIHGNPRPV